MSLNFNVLQARALIVVFWLTYFSNDLIIRLAFDGTKMPLIFASGETWENLTGWRLFIFLVNGLFSKVEAEERKRVEVITKLKVLLELHLGLNFLNLFLYLTSECIHKLTF